ncbi:MAG: TRAP transporter large permease [Betaproteobacteria bacterium]|nr:TRAP transporter large permease [Betaproteobacteria bacterium]
MSTALIAMGIVILVCALLRFSIVLMMFSSGIVYLWVKGQDIGLIVDQTLNSMFSMYVLLAVPMFIFAGNVMNASTVSERIWSAADVLVGRLRGGMGHITVLMNVVMSSMSGSAISDAAGPGMVSIRMMEKVGNYPKGLAVAIAAAASCLGPIIPGVVPGLLMALSLMMWIAMIAQKRNLSFGQKISWSQVPLVLWRAALPLTLPVMLLGGIWSGVFSPTESAAMAGLWAIVIGVFIYRNLGLKTLIAIFAMSARQSAVVMMLIASSFIVNYAITAEQVAVQLAAYIASLDLSAIVFMLLVNVMFLLLGTVLDGAVMLLVFVPVLLPTVNALGIDLVQFGVVVILNFMIAMITPPYGLILFVLGSLTGVPMKDINREIWQFCIPLSAVMFLMIFFPSITLWLPRMFGYTA